MEGFMHEQIKKHEVSQTQIARFLTGLERLTSLVLLWHFADQKMLIVT